MDLITYLRALRAWFAAFPKWGPPQRYRALLTMRNGHQFIRWFADLDEAKRLCNRVMWLDVNSSIYRAVPGSRFDWFAIDDTQTGLTYHVDDWDDYFGASWSEPTGRP
jgi:hypothetical protein